MPFRIWKADEVRVTGKERISFWRRHGRQTQQVFAEAMKNLPIPSGKSGDVATVISALASDPVEVTQTGDHARDKLRKLTDPKNGVKKYTNVG